MALRIAPEAGCERSAEKVGAPVRLLGEAEKAKPISIGGERQLHVASKVPEPGKTTEPYLGVERRSHPYDIEWPPSGVTTIVDAMVMRTWTKFISRMSLPQTILLTIWASSSASWAGPLQPSSAPTSADVDWIKVYDWRP